MTEPASDQTNRLESSLQPTHDASVIGQLRAEVERLRASEAALLASLDLMALGRYRSDPTTLAVEWDTNLKRMWGIAPDAAIDLDIFFGGIHPDDRGASRPRWDRRTTRRAMAFATSSIASSATDGGPERWVASRGKTVFENGNVAGFHGVVLDISERKRAEQTNLLLIGELEHRTRNLLAVVTALAEQTLDSCDSIDDFAGPFTQRLETLSRVQGLLSRGESAPVMIGELVELELCALGAEPDGVRVVVGGPDVALPNRSVQILALGLHELATNARKHGALGAPAGRLSVTWQVTGDAPVRHLALTWHECGIGTRQTPPKANHIGLGRTLIEKSLPFQLDAKTQLEIGRDEVRCIVMMALT